MLDLVVVRLPRISNFTDFAALPRGAGVGLRYADRPEQLEGADLILLPGTKSTMSDLKWLRESGLEAQILKQHAAGTPVFGVCGGYQMMGRSISDPREQRRRRFYTRDGASANGNGVPSRKDNRTGTRYAA